MTQQSAYTRLGGAEGVHRLVNAFYDLVETDPVGAPLMELHNIGNGLAHARQAQFEFMSGFLGGPQLYVERHGHSNVRKMHEHLQMNTAQSDAWVQCMDKALQQHGVDAQTHAQLMAHFQRIATMLVNS